MLRLLTENRSTQEEQLEATFSGMTFVTSGNLRFEDDPPEPKSSEGLLEKQASLEVWLLTENKRNSVDSVSNDTLNAFIALRIRDIPKVKRIFSKSTAGVFYTWIVIEERDREVLKAIYAQEKEIIKRFPEFGFDFYVIYGAEGDTDSLVSGVEQVHP